CRSGRRSSEPHPRETVHPLHRSRRHRDSRRHAPKNRRGPPAMSYCRQLLTVFAAALFACAGCSNLPGRPSESSIPVDPDDVTDFALLYGKNCSGCHGSEGKGGAALSLGDPVYLAIVDDATMRKIVTNGIGGTAMPAFAKSAGGMLTDKQID